MVDSDVSVAALYELAALFGNKASLPLRNINKESADYVSGMAVDELVVVAWPVIMKSLAIQQPSDRPSPDGLY